MKYFTLLRMISIFPVIGILVVPIILLDKNLEFTSKTTAFVFVWYHITWTVGLSFVYLHY